MVFIEILRMQANFSYISAVLKVIPIMKTLPNPLRLLIFRKKYSIQDYKP